MYESGPPISTEPFPNLRCRGVGPLNEQRLYLRAQIAAHRFSSAGKGSSRNSADAFVRCGSPFCAQADRRTGADYVRRASRLHSGRVGKVTRKEQNAGSILNAHALLRLGRPSQAQLDNGMKSIEGQPLQFRRRLRFPRVPAKNSRQAVAAPIDSIDDYWKIVNGFLVAADSEFKTQSVPGGFGLGMGFLDFCF